MAENVRWRVLEAGEWDKLDEFLRVIYGADAITPDPVLSTVIVLVDDTDEIAAAMSLILRPVVGPVAVGRGLEEEIVDTLFATGMEKFRTLCEDNKITDQVVLAFNDASKTDLMGELGFVELGTGAFIGNF